MAKAKKKPEVGELVKYSDHPVRSKAYDMGWHDGFFTQADIDPDMKKNKAYMEGFSQGCFDQLNNAEKPGGCVMNSMDKIKQLQDRLKQVTDELAASWTREADAYNRGYVAGAREAELELTGQIVEGDA